MALIKLLSLILLVALSNAENPDFPNFNFAESFHSRVVLRDLKTQESKVVLEFFSTDNKPADKGGKSRGLYIFDTKKGTTNLYYNGKTKKFASTLLQEFSCEVDDISKKNPLPDLWRFVDYSDDRLLMIGPTAILRYVNSEILKNNWDMQNEHFYKGVKIIRGILTNQWVVNIEKGEQENVELTFNFMTSDWTKAEKSKLGVPVRIVAKGYYRSGDERKDFAYEIDYIMFEDDSTFSFEFGQIIGLGCEGFTLAEDIEESAPKIDKNFAMTIETKLPEDPQKVHRFDTYVDKTREITRVDFFQDGEPKTMIRDGKHKAFFKFDEEECDAFENVENDEVGGRIKPMLDNLQITDKYNNIGSHYQRGIKCAIWQRVITDADEINKFQMRATDQAGNRLISKLVLVHFVSAVTVLEVDDINQVPVQSQLIVYRAPGRNGVSYPMFDQIFQYFDFRPLKYDKAYNQIFNVETCYPDPDTRKYIQLFVDQKQESGRIAQEELLIKQEVISKVAEIGEISMMRVSEVEIDYTDTGLIIDVEILEKHENVNEKTAAEAISAIDKSIDDSKFTFKIQWGDKDEDKEFKISKLAKPDRTNKRKYQKHFELRELDKKLNPKDETAKQIEATVTSIGDCFMACKTDQSLDCLAFSYCPNKAEGSCVISSADLDKLNEKDLKDGTLVDEDDCKLYKRRMLSQFTKVEGFFAETQTGTVEKDVTDAEACAQMCDALESGCQSLQYCSDKTCTMRKEHYIDVAKESAEKPKDDVTCEFYTMNYIQLFTFTGHDLVKVKEEEIIVTLPDTTVSACADNCGKDSDCKSFNFCPSSTGKDRSSCVLTKRSYFDDDTEFDEQPLCVNYDKDSKSILDRPVFNKTIKIPDPIKNELPGMGAGGFFGLIIGMLFVGAALGVAGYLGYKRFYKGQSVSSTSTAGAATVSFKTLREQDESA